MGPDSIMSNALPAGGPSRISVRTTSARSISTMRCAVVDPTNPPPTTVTFLRILSISLQNESLLREHSVPPAVAPRKYQLTSDDLRSRHILDDRGRER